MDVESTSAAAPSEGAAARRPIGEFLVERGLVSESELKQALAEQRSSGKRLGEILVERGAITRMALASVLGEQWEEAGRHLRAVVPVRLADGKEADVGLAGGEQLTDSLASLQAAVARLEDLSGGPGSERVVVGDEAIEASLAGLHQRLTELREAVAAPMVVETDHLGDRLAELDAYLRGRDTESTARVEQAVESLESLGSRVDAKLSELAEAAQPDPAVGLRLDRIDAWLRERDDGALAASVEAAIGRLAERLGRIEAPAPVVVDPELAERLGRVEALLSERPDEVSPELVRRLDEIEAAATREQPVVDVAPIEQRLDALAASVAEASTDELVARLESLERSLGAVRSAVEAPRDTELASRLGQIEQALGGRDLAWEAAVERLGRLEDSVREALERPVAADGDGVGPELSGRLEELRGMVAGLDGSVRPEELAERFGSLEHTLHELREAVDSPRDAGVLERLGTVEQLLGGRDLAWEAAVERLGRLEDSVRTALERPVAADGDGLGPELFGRLEELRGMVAGLDGSAGAARSEELGERFGSLEQSLAWLRAAVESPRDDGVAERLGQLESAVREAAERSTATLDPGFGEELFGRLDELRTVVTGLDGSAGTAPSAELAERFGSLEQTLVSLREAVDSSRDDGVAERLGQLESAVREAAERPTATLDPGSGEELFGRLDELRTVVAGLDGSAAVARSDELAERFGSLEHALHELRGAVASVRDDGLAERLADLEASLRAVAERPASTVDDGFGDQLFGRLEELQSAVASLPDERVAKRLGRLENALRELAERPASDPGLGEALHARLDDLRAAFEARDDSHRFDELARGVAEQFGRLEETLREATAPREDGRLDEALARLDALRGELAAGHERLLTHDTARGLLEEHAGRSDSRLAHLEQRVEEAGRIGDRLADGFAELRAALEAPAAELDSALAERDARIAELVEQLNARPAAHAPADDRPRPGDTTSFLALVPAPDGYRLVAFEGALPAAGDGLAVPDDDRPLVVARLGRSPYPGDARPCAYLQAS